MTYEEVMYGYSAMNGTVLLIGLFLIAIAIVTIIEKRR